MRILERLSIVTAYTEFYLRRKEPRSSSTSEFFFYSRGRIQKLVNYHIHSANVRPSGVKYSNLTRDKSLIAVVVGNKETFHHFPYLTFLLIHVS